MKPLNLYLLFEELYNQENANQLVKYMFTPLNKTKEGLVDAIKFNGLHGFLLNSKKNTKKKLKDAFNSLPIILSAVLRVNKIQVNENLITASISNFLKYCEIGNLLIKFDEDFRSSYYRYLVEPVAKKDIYFLSLAVSLFNILPKYGKVPIMQDVIILNKKQKKNFDEKTSSYIDVILNVLD